MTAHGVKAFPLKNEWGGIEEGVILRGRTFFKGKALGTRLGVTVAPGDTDSVKTVVE